LFISTGHYLPWLSSLAAVNYRATNASGVYGGAGIGIVPVPLLRTASAPTSGSAGRVAGVAYLTLKVHVPPTASGVVKEQVFAVTEYSAPMLTRRFSARCDCQRRDTRVGHRHDACNRSGWAWNREGEGPNAQYGRQCSIGRSGKVNVPCGAVRERRGVAGSPWRRDVTVLARAQR